MLATKCFVALCLNQRYSSSPDNNNNKPTLDSLPVVIIVVTVECRIRVSFLLSLPFGQSESFVAPLSSSMQAGYEATQNDRIRVRSTFRWRLKTTVDKTSTLPPRTTKGSKIGSPRVHNLLCQFHPSPPTEPIRTRKTANSLQDSSGP